LSNKRSIRKKHEEVIMSGRRLTAAILALCVLHPFGAGAATHEVSIVGLSFRPNNLTISVGDTVRWTNDGGSHDVRADSGEWASAIGFDTYERTFDSVEAILYHCSVHSAPGRNIDSNMNGRINVVAAQEPAFQINTGLSDAWYFPETGGQGFFIIVWEDIQQVFLSWFTYDTERPPQDVAAILGEPGHRWLTAQGSYQGDTASLDVNLTAGGVFDAAQPPAVTDPAPVGTITIAWAGCNEGILSYDLPGPGVAGEIPIERIVLDNVPACEAAQQPAQ
jgi:plastocyanin